MSVHKRWGVILGAALAVASLALPRPGSATTTSIALTGGGTLSWSQAILQDSFNRTTANGWGTPDVPGPTGQWTWNIKTANTNFSTAAGWGSISVPNAVPQQVDYGQFPFNIDAYAKLQLPKGVGATAVAVGMNLRDAGTGAGWYQVLASATSGGTVKLLGQTNVGVNLWAPFDTGIAVTPTMNLRMHAQVIGNFPTQINASLWLDGTAEPGAFQQTTTDNTAALQNSGGHFGIVATNATGSTQTVAVTYVNVHFVASTNTFPPVTLNGTDQTVTRMMALDVLDTRGTGGGWSVTLTSTTFTAGPNTLPNSAVVLSAPPAGICDEESTCSQYTNGVSYPLTVPAAPVAPAAAKIVNAAVNTGMGGQVAALNYALTVPAASYTGTYTSTWTITLAAGP